MKPPVGGGNRAGIGMTSARTRERLIQRLREQGIANPAVLDQIRNVPRHLFVDEALATRAYEDTALPIGRLRFRPAGSPGGHNGLKSIEAALGTREYARLRIGIGAKPPESDLADYVLSGFEPDEEAKILEMLPRALDGVCIWLKEGIDTAMRQCNN